MLGGVDERGLPYFAVQLSMLRPSLGFGEFGGLGYLWFDLFLLTRVSACSSMQGREDEHLQVIPNRRPMHLRVRLSSQTL